MIRGTIQYVRSPEVTAKEFGPAVAEGNAAAVEHWHDTYVPQHFTVAGAQLYGYQKRSGEGEPARVPQNVARKSEGGAARIRMVPNRKYWWRKQRQKGTTDPLVYSGDSRQQATTGAFKITSSRNRGTGVFTGLARYFYQYRKDLNQPDKADELTRVVEAEVDDMAKVHERTTTEYLERLKTATSVAVA